MGNMLGRRRSSGADTLPRWANDNEVGGNGRESEWRGFMAPLLNRAHQETTVVETYLDGAPFMCRAGLCNGVCFQSTSRLPEHHTESATGHAGGCQVFRNLAGVDARHVGTEN